MHSRIAVLAHVRKHQPHALVTDAIAPVESERRSCRVPGFLQRPRIVVVPKSADEGLREEGVALSERRIELDTPDE